MTIDNSSQDDTNRFIFEQIGVKLDEINQQTFIQTLRKENKLGSFIKSIIQKFFTIESVPVFKPFNLFEWKVDEPIEKCLDNYLNLVYFILWCFNQVLPDDVLGSFETVADYLSVINITINSGLIMIMSYSVENNGAQASTALKQLQEENNHVLINKIIHQNGLASFRLEP